MKRDLFVVTPDRKIWRDPTDIQTRFMAPSSSRNVLFLRCTWNPRWPNKAKVRVIRMVGTSQYDFGLSQEMNWDFIDDSISFFCRAAFASEAAFAVRGRPDWPEAVKQSAHAAQRQRTLEAGQGRPLPVGVARTSAPPKAPSPYASEP